MTEAELCIAVSRSVRQLAHRYRRWTPPHITEDDLYQDGMIYVVKTFRRRPGQTLSFYGTAARFGMGHTLAHFRRVGRQAQLVPFHPTTHAGALPCNDEFIVTKTLGGAINSLPPKMREHFIDWHVRDIKYSEIKRPISEGTFDSARWAAMSKVRKTLGVNI